MFGFTMTHFTSQFECGTQTYIQTGGPEKPYFFAFCVVVYLIINSNSEQQFIILVCVVFIFLLCSTYHCRAIQLVKK